MPKPALEACPIVEFCPVLGAWANSMTIHHVACPHCGEALTEVVNYCPRCLKAIDPRSVRTALRNAEMANLIGGVFGALFFGGLFGGGAIMAIARHDDFWIGAVPGALLLASSYYVVLNWHIDRKWPEDQIPLVRTLFRRLGLCVLVCVGGPILFCLCVALIKASNRSRPMKTGGQRQSSHDPSPMKPSWRAFLQTG